MLLFEERNMVFLTAEDGVKCDAFDSKYVTCIPTLYLGVNAPSPSHPTTHKRNDKNKSTRTNGGYWACKVPSTS